MMRYSQSGYQLTQQFESCRLKAYKDARGILTIGWGHTLEVHEGMTCTQAQADEWLRFDVGYCELAVNHLVKVPLSQGAFDALVDFVFNLGVSNFAHSTLLGLVNSRNYEAAATELEKWDHCAGKVLQGLLRRRIAEEKMFAENDEPQIT